MRNKRLRTSWLGTAVLLLAMLLVGCSNGATPGTTGPKLAVDATSLDFGTETDSLTFNIENAGDGDLAWSVEAGADWVSVSPAAGENAGEVTVTVDRAALTAGEHGTDVHVTSNGGSAQIVVTARVAGLPPPPPGRAPGDVRGLSASGWTLPQGVMPMAAAGGSTDVGWLLALADAFSSTAGPPAPTGRSVTAAAMPSGFQGVFVLEWDAVDATGYRIFIDAGGGWQQHASVSVGELENAEEPTYSVHGDFDVGDRLRFRVQAMNGDTPGEPSDAAEAFLIAPQTLSAPADARSVGATPQFSWDRHADATSYALHIAQGDRANRVRDYVTGDGNENSHTFAEAFAAGDYLWYVLTQGPRNGDGALAYALSREWTFEVAP